jgi:RsiW-degrading membrane proteinase PrsW (M82 family)
MAECTITIRRHKPKSSELLFFLLCGAVLSVPMTLMLQQSADPFLAGLSNFSITVITVVIFAPFIEEFSKIFPVLYRHGETERSIFTLALMVGLGFGIVEFFTYVSIGGPAAIIGRIPGLFFHPASTSITAYGVATRRPVPFYLAAVGLHFANNFMAVIEPIAIPTSMLVLGVTLFASWKLHDRTKEVFIDYPECSEPVTKAQT